MELMAQAMYFWRKKKNRHKCALKIQLVQVNHMIYINDFL